MPIGTRNRVDERASDTFDFGVVFPQMRILVEFLREPLIQWHLMAMLVVGTNEAPDDLDSLGRTTGVSECDLAQQICLTLVLAFIVKHWFRDVRHRKSV